MKKITRFFMVGALTLLSAVSAKAQSGGASGNAVAPEIGWNEYILAANGAWHMPSTYILSGADNTAIVKGLFSNSSLGWGVSFRLEATDAEGQFLLRATETGTNTANNWDQVGNFKTATANGRYVGAKGTASGSIMQYVAKENALKFEVASVGNKQYTLKAVDLNLYMTAPDNNGDVFTLASSVTNNAKIYFVP